jgi:peptide/nickel transport system permease protein
VAIGDVGYARIDQEHVLADSAPSTVRPGFGALSWIAISFLAFVFAVSLIGPLLFHTNPDEINLLKTYGGPQDGAILGFDGQGRNLLARLIYGGRTALLGPLVVVGISATLGSGIALTGVWLGGWMDTGIARIIDAMFAFPGILLAILAVALFGPGLLPAGVGLALAYTPYHARIIRSAALKERAQPYVDALTGQGFGGVRIVLRHIVPNLSGLMVATATLGFGYALIDLAGLSFIGLGVQPPAPDWGVMVADGVPGILGGYPQESIYAATLIVLTIVCVNLLGDKLHARWEVAA